MPMGWTRKNNFSIIVAHGVPNGLSNYYNITLRENKIKDKN